MNTARKAEYILKVSLKQEVTEPEINRPQK